MSYGITDEVSNKIRNMSFVCACFVVAIHTYPRGLTGIESSIHLAFSQGITRLAVPFFFLVSGFMLAGHMGENGWWKRAVVSRIRTLLIPYLCWTALFVLYRNFVQLSINLVRGTDWVSGLVATDLVSFLTVFGVNPVKPISGPILYPLWFLRTLLFYIFISFSIEPLLKSRCRMAGVLLILAVLYALVAPFGTDFNFGFKVLFGYVFSLEGAFYFMLGIFLRRYPIRMRVSRCWYCVLLALSFVSIYVLYFSGLSFKTTVNLVVCDVPLRWFALPLWMLTLWLTVPSKPLSNYLIQATFGIYVLHLFVRESLSRVVSLVPAFSFFDTTVLGYFCYIILSVGGAVVFTNWVKNVSPTLKGVLFGGR